MFESKAIRLSTGVFTFLLAAVLALALTSAALQQTVSSAESAPAALTAANFPLAAAAPARSAAAAPQVVDIVATKTDSLLVDNDGDSAADPGDTLRYTVVIRNNGDMDATGVAFADDLDANTVLSGTVRTTPLALDDSYLATGNVGIAPPAASGLLSNDIDPDGNGGNPLAISAFDSSSAQGGDVAVNSDGSFTYAPPAGFEGPDSFTYTIQDGDGNTDTATVSITVGDMIWFIDNSAAAAGDGRLSAPFDTLAAFEAVNGGGAGDPAAGAAIFIYETGSGDYTGGLTPENDQLFIGQGASGSIDSIAGITLAPFSSPLPATGGASPVIANSSGAGIALAQNNALYGLNVGDTSGAGISGSGFVTLIVRDVAVQGTGQALDLANGDVDALFSGLSTTAAANPAISLNQLTTTNFAADATGLTGLTGVGILVQNSGGASFDFGATTITASGGSGAGVDVATNNAAATFAFDSLNVTTFSGAGLVANNSGTINVGGSGNSISAAGGPAVDVTSTSFGGGAVFSAVSSSNSAGLGVNLVSVSGSFTANGGAISNAGGVAFNVNGGGDNITYAGSISNSSNRSAFITGRTAGVIDLAGSINDTGLGILVQSNSGGTMDFSGSPKTISTGVNPAVTLTANSGHTINFSGGGLAITTSTGVGFSASGGAAGVSVTGAGNTIGASGGVALTVDNTTIGASGLNFQSISANGGGNGIILNATGALGGLNVTGAGAAGSGGAIQNMTGANGAVAGRGVSLNNTQNVALAWMQLNDFSNYAIRGDSVTGFTLVNSVIDGVNGDSAADDEGSVSFVNLLGSASIEASNISGGLEDNVRILNNSGALDRLTVTGSTIGANSTALGNDGILVEVQSSAVVSVTVTGSTFTSARGDLFQSNVLNSATMDLVFTNNMLSNNHPNIASGGGGTVFSGGGAGSAVNFTYNISGNTFRDALGIAVNVFKGSGAGSFSGRIENNQIGVPGVSFSGSAQASGLVVASSGSGAHTALINNNQIYRYNENGILVRANDGSSTLNATLTNNTIAEPESFALNGIQVVGGAISSDSNFICADITSNSFVGSGGAFDPDFNLRQRFLTTMRLPGYGGANNDNAAVVAFVQGANTGTPSGSASNNVAGGGGGFVGGAACAQPAALAQPAQPLNQAEAASSPAAQPAAVVAPAAAAPAAQPKADAAAAPAPTQEAETAPIAPIAAKAAGLARLVDRASAAPALAPISPLTIGVLPAGEAITITFDVRINDPVSPGAVQISNQGAVSGSNFTDVLTDDPDTAAADDPTVTPLDLETDLAVTKSDGQTTAIPGAAITYTIIVSNAGPQAVSGALVTDTFSSALSSVAWTCVAGAGATCTASGSGDISDSVSLAASSRITYTASGLIDSAATGSLANTATVTVTTGVGDSDPANNSATDIDTLTPEADLAIGKADSADPVLAGDTFTYTIAVTNSGPSDAQGVVVTDTLPSGLSALSTAGCAEDPNGAPRCTLGVVAANRSVSYTIRVSADPDASGVLTNEAVLSANTADPIGGNDLITETTTILGLDYGDAPDPLAATPGQYPTLRANDGARHVISGPFLGASVDQDGDGQPNADATGDDTLDGNDDEDGVALPNALVRGAAASVDVTANGACLLNAWIDFNQNGVFGDSAGEQIFTDQSLSSGLSAQGFAIPATALTGDTFARFRCSTAGGLLPTGQAADGEVEDYQVTILDNLFSVGDVSQAEGDSGLTQFSFVITRTNTASASAVDYRTGGGTATPAIDYTAVATTTVNFAAGGAPTQTVVINVTGDALVEPDETFFVTLSNPVNGAIGDGQGLGVILNDDAVDLAISKSVEPDTAVPGDPITYTLAYANLGNGLASGVVITDLVPTTIQSLSVASSGAAITQTGAIPYVWQVANLSQNDGGVITISGVISTGLAAGVQIANTATITGSTDVDLANNQGGPALTTILNAPPLAEDDFGSTDENTLLSVADPGLLANDSDLNGDALTVSGFEAVSANGAAVSVNGAGGYLYDPSGAAALQALAAGEQLIDTVVYTVTDGAEAVAATLFITVAGVNDDPALGNVAITSPIEENASATLSGSIGDPDASDTFTLTVNWGDGSPVETLTYAAGTTSFSVAHQYEDDNPSGTPSDSYAVALTLLDSSAGSDAAGVNVVVNNAAPAVDAGANQTVAPGQTVTLDPATFTDPGALDTHTAIIDWDDGTVEPGTVTEPAAGPGLVSGSHAYANVGLYTVEVCVGDDDSGVGCATLTVDVTNTSPVANDDSFTTDEDTPLSAPPPGVLDNDSDAEDDPLTAVLVTTAAHGALTLNSDGSFDYTPAANFCGLDSFTYRANDGYASSNLATVTIEVFCVEDPPMAVDDSAYSRGKRVTIWVLDNDFDPDGDPLTLVSVSDPAHGTTRLLSRRVLYTPAWRFRGVDTFTYTITDGNGNFATATVTVTVF